MATIHTLIDYDRQNPTAITREAYNSVGADAWSPGTFPRAFIDLEVYDVAVGGVALILDADYELVDVDYELSGANYENETVYKTLRVINAAYQACDLWLTYNAIGTYPTADLHDPSELPAAAALVGTEPIATVQTGEAVKMTPAQIETFGAGVRETITAKAADYVILDDNLNIYEMTTAAVDRTVTLPTLADNLGRVIELHKVDDGAGKATLDGEGAETIDGNLTVVLPSQYNYIKVRAGTATWHILEIKANYAKWVANNDWTDAELTATHKLGAPLSDLVVKFFVSTDGTETGAFEIFPQGQNTGYAAGDYGFTLFAIDDDSLKIEMAKKGILYTNETGSQIIIAAQAWYYKVAVYRLK